MNTFKIIPVLGLKTSVQQDDPTLFRFVGENVAYTHDVGGVNVDYKRKHNACTKSWGLSQWSNSANAQATKCMGLYELYDSSGNRNYIYFDNGLAYYYDSNHDPTEIAAAAPVTFASDDADFYSIIKVGDYVVWADYAEHTPYKWKHGDANSSKLIQSGTEYKFRYLASFQRRVIGAYSDQTDGDIDVRWSTAWPTTAITSLNYPAANQLYIPNDDPIVSVMPMGRDRCFIGCENSIHSLDYTENYSTPFKCRTVNSQQGPINQFSIINMGGPHFFFNKYYGFCSFDGQRITPISQDIELDLQDMNNEYVNRIYGDYVPLTRELVWAVPLDGGSVNSHLLFYQLDTGNWRKEDKVVRCVNSQRMYDNYTWNDFIDELGGTGATWPASPARWADYTHHKYRLAYANTDGHLYYSYGESDLSGSNLDGYRIEPILDFGDSNRREVINEIWFSIGVVGNYSIDVYYRSGETTGELVGQGWTSIGSISCNSPSDPVLYPQGLSAKRLHQIKWGTNLNNEKFEVNAITFKYVTEDRY